MSRILSCLRLNSIESAHCVVGLSIVVAFLVLCVAGGLARLLRRPELGRPFWGLLYYTETVLVIQVVFGLGLFLSGRRAPGHLHFLHYLYGSVFPLIAVLAGRLYALRRKDQEYDYAPVAFWSFVAFGLTTRALMTGLGIG